MYKLLLLSIIFILSLSLKAQTTNDVIYLSNGNIMRGKILEQSDSATVKIETLCGNVFNFNKTEIDNITKEKGFFEQQRNQRAINGWFAGPTLGLNMGLESEAAFSFKFAGGYRFMSYFGAGAGVALENYNDLVYVPVFASTKLFALKKVNSPYLEGKLGYSIATTPDTEWEEYKGGIMASASGVLSSNISDNSLIQFKLGYRVQHTTIAYPDWGWNDYKISDKYKYYRFTVGVSLVFF